MVFESRNFLVYPERGEGAVVPIYGWEVVIAEGGVVVGFVLWGGCPRGLMVVVKIGRVGESGGSGEWGLTRYLDEDDGVSVLSVFSIAPRGAKWVFHSEASEQ